MSTRPPLSLELIDAPEEWLRFSQAKGEHVWDSQVLIQGMHCAACAFAVEAALLAVPGVRLAEVNAATQRARVVWAQAQVLPSQWMGAVRKAGYAVVPAADASSRLARQAAGRRALWQWLVAGFCMMQVMMYAYPAYVSQPGEIEPDMVFLLRWASWVLTLPVIFFSCGPFFGNAWRDLRARRVSMDLPVALGMAVTFALSSAATFEPNGVLGGEVYYDSLTMFVFFLLTGRWLEWRVRDRTAGALDALMNRLPESVERQLPSGAFEQVAVRRLLVGDVIRVSPAQSFPADGVVLQGHTLVDEALLTGESRPQTRSAGAQVVAGSHNLSGIVTVRVTQVGEGTQFSRIVALMANAALQKPRLAQLADRVAKPFLVGVLLLALGAALWWWPTSPSHALMVAVAVLVVTCPCALSLATPAAMLAAAGQLAKHGVLVRQLQALEALAEIDTLIFDKTGTLTQDGQRLTQVWTAPDVRASEALALAAALAQHSLHPFSRALVKAYEREPEHTQAQSQAALAEPANADAGPATHASAALTGKAFKGHNLAQATADVREVIGQGLMLALGPHLRLRLGSAAFCALAQNAIPEAAQAAQVHLCSDTEWLASWCFSEDVREDALATVQALQKLGLDVWLLSGDRPEAAQQVAQQLGITQAWGACTPSDKLQRLQAAQAGGARVAMVGDGLNDGPVLAGAHVSMALGQAVPLAQSSADLVLMGSRLMVVAQSVALARRTLRIVRQNLAWAAAYNAVCVPLAVLGYLPAWLAGLGMALSSLWVVLNALRLTRGF